MIYVLMNKPKNVVTTTSDEKARKTVMDKHKCKAVKFQVYVKDGKAALKATPVKD